MTAKEKKNLFKLQILLLEQNDKIKFLVASGRVDSAHIVQLNETISNLQQQVEQAFAAKDYGDKAYKSLMDSSKLLKREIRLLKIKGVIAGTFGAVGAFGAGVGVAFIILKTN